MKTGKILSAVLFIFLALLMVQCEKYGDRGGIPEPDPDSDRPAWAGGNTDANEHNKKGDSGGNPGVEYGDQIMLDRDENGVPILYHLVVEGAEETVDEWIVRPVDVDGYWLEIDETNVETAGELLEGEDPVEIDFGRLNIVKSPESVLNQALNEALNVLDPSSGNVTISVDYCGRLHSYYENDDGEMVHKTIDSPRENMAIYKYLMQNLFEGDDNKLAFLGNWGLNPLDVAASCFAAGSDKTGFVDMDEVVYINGIIDCYGLEPIENCLPYINYTTDPDAEELNRDGTVRQYFDFGQSGMDEGPEYVYNRSRYSNHWLQFLVWENQYYPVDPETGLSGGPKFTVLQVAEGQVGNWGSLFRDMWQGDKTRVEGFAWAIDDAVQILEFVHGDSNIRYVDAAGNPL